MAKNENRNTNRVESVVRASVQRKIGGKIASKIASSAIAKSVGSALGSTLGSVVPIVGNVLGGVLGNAISGGIVVLSKNLGKALGALPFALSNLGSNVAQVVAASLAQALGTSFAFMTAAIVVLAIFASFTMFIINSGAYIVPPGGLSGGGTIPIEGERVGCFLFTSTWNAVPENYSNIQTAAQLILSRPGAVDKICASGDITVDYQAVGLIAGGLTSSANSIEISRIGSNTPTGALYTLAHESGHIVSYRNSNVETLYRTYTSNGYFLQDANRQAHPQCDADGLLYYLPSYGCFDRNADGVLERVLLKSASEDRMESIGLWLMLPLNIPIISEFGGYQTGFPMHFKFAQDVFAF